MDGVLSVLEAVMSNSRRRGMPRVTFAPPCPAKWNVLRVICVEGSPTDCAASVPTFSPGAASDRTHLASTPLRSTLLLSCDDDDDDDEEEDEDEDGDAAPTVASALASCCFFFFSFFSFSFFFCFFFFCFFFFSSFSSASSSSSSSFLLVFLVLL